jgi:hypothetical protein
MAGEQQALLTARLLSTLGRRLDRAGLNGSRRRRFSEIGIAFKAGLNVVGRAVRLASLL